MTIFLAKTVRTEVGSEVKYMQYSSKAWSHTALKLT